MPILTFPYNCFVGLAVGGVEVTVPGYVRQPITLAYCEDGITLSNLASAQWQHATYSWGAIDGVQLWDSLSGGNLLVSLTVAGTSLLIAQYDIARIPASGLTVTYDKVNRPFGVGAFGTFGYGTYRIFNAVDAALLERAFDQQLAHVCEPGTWTPGPFSLAA